MLKELLQCSNQRAFITQPSASASVAPLQFFK